MTTKPAPLLLLLIATTATSYAPNALAQPQPQTQPPPSPATLPPAPPLTAFTPIGPGVGILTSRSEQGYTLLINSATLPPESIRVDIDPRGVLIHSSGQHQSSERRSGAPGQGQFQSYSYSSSYGSFTRRLPMPRDADPSGAVREDKGQRITIFIPLATQQ